MKKVYTLLLAVIMFVATAGIVSADTNKDFSYGQTKDGYYCYDGNCNIVYGKDASLIGDVKNRKNIGSSMWYIRRLINKKQYGADSTFQNRVDIMKTLRYKK